MGLHGGIGRALALLLLFCAAPGIAGKKPRPAGADSAAIGEGSDMAPDFSTVTTRAAAEKLVRQGRLVRILVFPAELGGEDVPMNQTYVPPALVAVLDKVRGTVMRFTAEGLIDWMSVTQDWHGESIVPARITYHCMNKRKGDTGDRFVPSVEIW